MQSDVAPTHPPDDLKLASLIAHGDRAAFETLMRRYNRRLFRLARAVLGNAAEAEDAVQDGYLRAYRSIDGFRGEAALSTWLSKLVLNECLARRRRQQRRDNIIPLTSAETHMTTVCAVADDSARPDRLLARAQIRGVLERKVGELPEDFRLVFVLRSVEEMGVDEVAQVLSIPEETVRSRHFRARSLLRESVAREVDLAERDLFEFGGAQCDDVVARVLGSLDDVVRSEPHVPISIGNPFNPHTPG